MVEAALAFGVFCVLVLLVGAGLRVRRRRARARDGAGRARFAGPRPGGVLVLVGADWPRTTLDGAALDVEPGTAPEAIDVIFPGRHRLETDLGDGRVAVWDVSLEKGAVLARRLDRVRGEWVACEAPRGSAPPVVVAFSKKSRRAPDAAVREARERIRALLSRIASGEPRASAVAQAARIGDALVGVPLGPTDWLELRGPFELAARAALPRDVERARTLALAGLAILPEDAALLAVGES